MTTFLHHYRFTLFTFLLIFFFSCENLWAKKVTVTTFVDKNPSTLEDIINLSVKITGVRQSTSPELPGLPNFKVQKRGTSSSVSIINGSMEASVTHNFQLIPKEEGIFELKPIKVHVENQTYKSNSLKIKINKKQGSSSNNKSLAFAKLSVSNQRPFINEQVVLTFKLYRRIDAKGINLDWSFEPFQKEDLGKAREYPESIKGVKFLVHELNVALFGPRVGSFQIEPATVELDLVFQDHRRQRGSPFNSFFNDPFFNMGQRLEHKILRSNPITIDVQSLPSKNKPTNFSNLVGQFDINGSLDKKEVETGDTTTLTIDIIGSGNLQNMELQPPVLEKRFKVYPDQPQFQKYLSNQTITGKKIFKYALVPLESGELAIPLTTLSYFDPKIKKYKTTQTKPIIIKVKPSKVVEEINALSPVKFKKATPNIEILGRDILPLHTNLNDFKNQTWGKEDKRIYLGGLLIPIISYFCLFFYIRYKRRLRDDVAFSRARKAYKQARKKFDHLSNQSTQDSKIFAQELSQTLREYIGNKLNLRGTAFTSSEVEKKLKEQDYSDSQVAETRQLLEKYEALQYGSIEKRFPKELLDESINILEKLER